jgi:hypothetical protein
VKISQKKRHIIEGGKKYHFFGGGGSTVRIVATKVKIRVMLGPVGVMHHITPKNGQL